MRAMIIDRDPFRRRISRAALKLYNPMMQIAEADRIFIAKNEYGYTFAPNFLIIDMELPGASGYIENLLQNNISVIPQIYAYEGTNKRGVCQRLMIDRNCRRNEKGYLGQVPVSAPPSQEDSNEPPNQLFSEEGQSADGFNIKLIVTFEWPQTTEEFYEVLRKGYEWRGPKVQNTPFN